jgi:hypothetical protein
VKENKMAHNRAVRFVKFLVIGIVFISIFVIGFGQAVLHLWNWLMPAVFGLHQITYWQAVGLLGLCWILFGGQRGWMRPHMGRGRNMRGRWEKMTPAEREKFRAGMRARCGMGSPAPEPKL